MKTFFDSINNIQSSVWGFLCICIGTALVVHNNDNGGTGRDMIVGGFALVTGNKLGGGTKPDATPPIPTVSSAAKQ